MAGSWEQDLRANLERARARVRAAARRAGREPGQVRLMAVAKTVPAEQVAALARLGVRYFGENRVEEAEGKLPLIRDLLGPDLFAACRWCLVGHLQSRKAARAVRLFDEIHSVDSVRLATRLDRLAAEQGRVLPVLLELNVSGEASKYGLAAGAWAQLAAEIEAIVGLRHLAVGGLMTVAPLAADPETVRPVFARLRELRDALARRWPALPWQELSMGMSDDYEVAVEEGATMIRLGRALFGART